MLHAVEAEWSAVGNAGVSVDDSVLYAVSERHRGWWWPHSSQVWQVQKFWETIIQTVVLSLLILASDTHWLAGISDQSVGQAPD